MTSILCEIPSYIYFIFPSRKMFDRYSYDLKLMNIVEKCLKKPLLWCIELFSLLNGDEFALDITMQYNGLYNALLSNIALSN